MEPEVKTSPGDIKKKIKNVSFSGGAFKGIGLVGCYSAMFNMGLCKDVEAVAGSSAGAFVAVGLAFRTSPEDLEYFIHRLSEVFNDYQVSVNTVLKYGHHFTHTNGLYSNHEMVDIYKEFLKHLSGSEDLTFSEMYLKTKCDVYITASCLDTNTVFYFSNKTTPQTTVVRALEISTNIPLLFEPKKHDDRTMVDGCVSEALPMKCWKESDLESTVAFLVKSQKDIFRVQKSPEGIHDYLNSLYKSVRRQSEEAMLEKYKNNIAVINVGNVKFLSMPSKEEIDMCIHSSYFQTVQYLSTKSFIDVPSVDIDGIVLHLGEMDSKEPTTSIEKTTPTIPLFSPISSSIICILIIVVIMTVFIKR